MSMKTLNIFILGKERELELKALLDSFFKYSLSKVPVKITVFYDDSNRETFYHHITYNKFLKEYSHFKFIQVNYNENPPNIEDYLVPGEYNLVLPDNTIFTQDFDLSKLEQITDEDILDLFKGLNRQKNSINVAKSLFLSEAHTWKSEGALYSIEKEGVAFEQLPKHNHFKYYGKIFVHNTLKQFEDKKVYFFPFSPCFINALNTVHEYIDFYDIDLPKEYNAYAFSIRYMNGETIDLDEMKNYTPNALLDQYRYKFVKDTRHKKLHHLVSYVLYINLDHREDRKLQIEKEITKLNLTPIRITGEIPDDSFVQEKINLFTAKGTELDENSLNLAKSRMGCTLSHLKAIKYAKEHNWDYALILEDDCEFFEHSLENINLALSELPSVPNFDILYLGANVVTPTQSISTHLAKIKAVWCLHGYIIPKHMYDVFLAFEWNNFLAIDSYIMSLQQSHNCYIVAPLVSVQRPSFSDIENKDVDYSEMMKYYFNAMLNKNDN